MTLSSVVSSDQEVADRPPLTMAEFKAMNVEVLSGVGRAKAKALAAVEVESVLDLLTYYPRRYIDRTNQADNLRPGRRCGGHGDGSSGERVHQEAPGQPFDGQGVGQR